MTLQKPSLKPERPFFSSGPTCKIPGWSPAALPKDLAGRNHRSKEGLAALQDLIAKVKRVLEIPESYLVALVPGSATGAVESMMWNFLGTRPVQALAFDVFGARWQQVVSEQLCSLQKTLIGDVESDLPDLGALNFDEDVLLTWNGSTGGLCLPDGEQGAWIPDDRQGLTLCDATSAVFALPLPWEKLDVTGFSWQKGLGGEAAHGMIALSPRAVQHLKDRPAAWPLPFLFCLRRAGSFNAPLFEGFTLNTPSLLCVQDALMALDWALSIGGLPALLERTKQNAACVLKWCEGQSWIRPLRASPETRSLSTLCLELVPGEALDRETLWCRLNQMRDLIETEQAGYDFLNHAKAQPCLRLWCGPTVETQDLEAFLPWLSYAFHTVFQKKV